MPTFVKTQVVAGGGAHPQRLDQVELNYRWSDQMDWRFLTFCVGQNEVHSPMEQAVLSMQVGEEARFAFRPEEAFGILGSVDGQIPPNAPLNLEIRLNLIIEAIGSEDPNLSPDEKLHQGLINKEKGNTAFKKGEFKQAQAFYEGIIKGFGRELDHSKNPQFIKDEDPPLALKDLLVSCFLNLGAIFARQSDHGSAIRMASEALHLDPQCMKAYFKRAQAYQHFGMIEQAQADWLKCVQLEPQNPLVRDKFKECQEVAQEWKLKQRQVYSKFFA